MSAQGEETVYPALAQLGKFCLCAGDLSGRAGGGKKPGWTRGLSFSNDRLKVIGGALNALG
jgi:hypothetical protein